MSIEENLQEALAARVAVVPDTVDLADSAIAGGRRIRRRRAMVAITGSVVAVVAAALVVVQVARQPVAVVPADPTSISVAPAPGSPRPRLDLVDGLVLRRAGGGQVALPAVADMRVADAVRVVGGWLLTYQRVDSLQGHSVVLVREDGSSAPLGQAPDTAVVVDRDGKRAVVQFWNGSYQDGTQVANAVVVEFPSGTVVARTPLPAGDQSMVVRAWSGDLVVLARVSGDFGAVPVDAWNPARGAFVVSPVLKEFAILGRFGAAGHLLAMVSDTDSQDACLVEVDPAAEFAVLRKVCRVGLAWEPPPVSNDGQYLLWQRGTEWIAHADLLTGSGWSKGLGTMDIFDSPDFYWETETAVLIAGHRGLGLLRCHVDGSPCERATLPGVDTEKSVVVRRP
ncbi:hypothetical protein [Alloactinosynnema sp. L-07]|uniref:hypothetical protein n=1 Tax=Alloactinosynnema sp. L-07 TaxID=1653480 RepID=UPI00065F0787|nr:hypothetical protein [Alloactinosynnema sp. L-07]CRK60952.1 hypothetical protein [Alloactinosynnema sp. L-07]